MSEHSLKYTSAQITETLVEGFAAPLIISTLGFILFGATSYHFATYFSTTAKGDPTLTRVWASLVSVMTTAATLYQVYFNWTYSINSFNNTPDISPVNGNVIVLYSVVVMLVQSFWLVCLEALLSIKFKLRVIAPIAMGSFTSFILAIVVGVLSATAPPIGVWPTPKISFVLRVMLGIDLGVDLSILLAFLLQLRKMKSELVHLRKTFSRLSWIVPLSALVSTMVMVVELVINFPPPSDGSGWINIVITLAPVISSIYAITMFSILNARGDLSSSPGSATSEASHDAMHGPQMTFTNQVHSETADQASRRDFLRNHAATDPVVIQGDHVFRDELAKESRRGEDANADQTDSAAQFGIQTI